MFLFMLFFLFIASKGNFGAILESVDIPSYAEKGEDVTLVCRVKMNRWEEDLYSLKWFKNDDEFYSFKPENEGRGAVQITRLEGARVKAKKSWPNAVVLRKVNLKSTGVYRCEIITKKFDIQEKYAKMTVIDKLHKKDSNVPFYTYMCMKRGKKSRKKYWRGKYGKKHCKKHLEDENIWKKYMIKHLVGEEETKWRGQENWKEVDKQWKEEGKQVTFITELKEKPEDKVVYLGERMHNFLDSVWGGFCTGDDSCAVISYCKKDDLMGSCRILWWFYLIIIIIALIHVFYCICCFVEYLGSSCKNACCKFFPCFKCRRSRHGKRKHRKAPRPRGKNIIAVKNQAN